MSNNTILSRDGHSKEIEKVKEENYNVIQEKLKEISARIEDIEKNKENEDILPL